MYGLNRSQRDRIRTIFKSLARLQNEIKDPDIVEHLSQASFELVEISGREKISTRLENLVLTLRVQKVTVSQIMYMTKLSWYKVYYILRKNNMVKYRKARS